MVKKQDKQKKKIKLLKVYADLRKKLGRDVKIQDLKAKGWSKDSIQYYWDSLRKLDKAARKEYPDKFFDALVDNVLSPKKIKDLRDAVGDCKRFVITTAVVGCPVDSNFLQSIKHYCKLNDAKLLVLLADDPAAMTDDTVDKKLTAEHIVFEDTWLNSNIFLSTLKISAKQIDGTLGLSRIGQRRGSFIFASPKQRLLTVPVSNAKMPRTLMSTGAVTSPAYNTDRYMARRTAYIAEHDHVMGAIIVEVEDNKYYHFRQIQADGRGAFIDLGVKYKKNSTENCAPVALIPGDWHSGETDPVVEEALKDVMKQLQPKTLILHDAFNGTSINHHEENDTVSKVIRARKGLLDLEDELEKLTYDINDLATYVSNVVIVKSNHDEFLEQYLKYAKYVKDPQNHYFCLDLAKAMMDGQDPLRVGVEAKGLKFKRKIRWLTVDEDYKISGIELGAHGHLGAHGARGSIKAMEGAYGDSVSAHSHTPQILRGAWVVGTSSFLKLSYNRGASAWMQTACLIYSNGSRQLLNIIRGKWRM